MAYRTYKELFRVRAEVSSIGTGGKRVVLPEWATITMDVLIMFVLTLPITRYVIAPLPNLFISAFLNIDHPILLWIEGAVMSGFIAVYLHKKEAAGKTPLQFIGTLLGFAARAVINSWHDGWRAQKIDLQTHKNVQVAIRRYDDRACGSLPARGYGVKTFTLTSTAAVRLRGSRIDFTKTGANKLGPGVYRIEGKKIVAVKKPARRQPPSLREED